MSILGNLETMGADVLRRSSQPQRPPALIRAYLATISPRRSRPCPQLSHGSPKKAPPSKPARRSPRGSPPLPRFDVPGAADAALGIEIAAEDIPEIVAVGQEVLPVLTTLMGPSTAPRWLGAPRAI